jgi:hypothetical protein
MFLLELRLTEGQGERGFPIAQDSYPSKEPPDDSRTASPRPLPNCRSSSCAAPARTAPLPESVCRGGGHGASALRPCSITGSRKHTAALLMRKNRSFLGFVPLQGPSRWPEIPLPPSPQARDSFEKEAHPNAPFRTCCPRGRSQEGRQATMHGEPHIGGTMPGGLAPDRHRATPKGSGGGRAHRGGRNRTHAPRIGAANTKCTRRDPIRRNPFDGSPRIARTPLVGATGRSRANREARENAGEPAVDQPPMPSKSVQS